MTRTATGSFVVLLLAGIAGFWLSGGDDGAPRQAEPTLLDLMQQVPTLAPPDAGSVAARDEPAEPAPGSMQVTLLDTTEQHRALIVRSTIRDAGFECDEIRSALPVGRDGFNWRVNCGDAQTYWIEVDGFGRLSARPMPYGDVEPPIMTPQVTPESERTLDLPTPE